MILTLLFWGLSAGLLASAAMVIVAQHPVRSALFLVLCFFFATGLWLLLTAEFLALTLILVYVGAVMTLFLFVIMTMKTDFSTLKRASFCYYLPLGLIITALLSALFIYALMASHYPFIVLPTAFSPEMAQPSNVAALGTVLYTQYAFPFEVAAVILLMAMIAAISLTIYEPIHRKQQVVENQIRVKREDRVKLIKDLK